MLTVFVVFDATIGANTTEADMLADKDRTVAIKDKPGAAVIVYRRAK